MYGIKLPDAQEIYQKSLNAQSNKPINANCYTIINKNDFVKAKGEKCEVRVDKEENIMVISSRLSWFQKLMLMINMFIGSIMDKIMGFFENLIVKLTSKIPAGLIGFVAGAIKVSMAIIAIPFLILKAIFSSVNIVMNQMRSNGLMGLVIGIVLAILMFCVQLFIIALTAVLSPVMDKIVDKVINRNSIRKMMIGHFSLNNNYNGIVIVSPDMVTSVTYDVKSSFLGKDKLCVVIKESEEKSSFIDRFKAYLVPTYFINRQTVIITDITNKEKLENIFKV